VAASDGLKRLGRRLAARTGRWYFWSRCLAPRADHPEGARCAPSTKASSA